MVFVKNTKLIKATLNREVLNKIKTTKDTIITKNVT